MQNSSERCTEIHFTLTMSTPLPHLDVNLPTFSVRTEARKRSPRFSAAWARYTLQITDLDLWRNNDPIVSLSGILDEFLKMVLSKDCENDVFRIVITDESKTITPISTRYLKSYMHTSAAILLRTESVLLSHEELQLGEPLVVHVTQVSTKEPSEQLAHFMHENAENTQN